jgi:HlyD family secretion protein
MRTGKREVTMRTKQPESVDGTESEVPSAPSISVRLRSLQLDNGERRNTGRFRWWKVFFLLTALAAIGAAGSYGYVNIYVPSNYPEVEVFVFTSKATQETLLDLSGYIVPRTKINVAADVGGTITQVRFEEGQVVNKGDLLIQIDDERYKAEYDAAVADLGSAEVQLLELRNGARPEELDQARALLDQAKAKMDLAVKDYKRALQLSRDAMAKTDVDRFLSSYQEAEANVRNQAASHKLTELGPREERIRAAQYAVGKAQAAVTRAKWFLDKAKINAPITGTVLEKKTEVGESVHPEVVSPALLVLADLARLDAEVGVQERDLNLLKKCDRCEIIPDAYSERVYQGRIDRLQPQVSRQRGVVQVKLVILDPDAYLMPDANCRVLFVKDPPKDADKQLPLIPKKALVDDEDNRKSVYVLEDKVARRRFIELGEPRDDSVEVVEGLQHGDIVLIPGAQPLGDGQPVRPKLPSRDVPKKDR